MYITNVVSEVASVANDAMGDDLGKNLISNYDLGEVIVNQAKEWLSIAWQYGVGASFWIACIGCIIFMILYATTLDKKYSKKASVLFVLYIILKSIDCVV